MSQDFSVDQCSRCGKQVYKKTHADSSDLIFVGGSPIPLIYWHDVPGKTQRPSLILHDEYCPDCLVAEITDFVAKVKKLKPSKIDPSQVKCIPNKHRKTRSDVNTSKAVDMQSTMDQFIKPASESGIIHEQ